MAEAVFPAGRLKQIILCVRWRIISPKRLSEQKLAGFQRVMLHGGHEWLQEQYVSPLTNHRTDEYGASMKNRFAAVMSESLVFVRDACRSKSKTEARQKAPTTIHAYGWKSGPYCISRDSTKCNTFWPCWRRKRKGSNGNRLFPWHTILLARSRQYVMTSSL